MKRFPTWVAGVVAGGLFAGAWLGVTSITTPELGFGARVLLSIVTGAFYGLFMGIWIRRVRRQHGPAAQRPGFNNAVRRGTVPPDVDITEWRRSLEARHRQYRPLRWMAPVFYLPMTALAIWLAITGQPLFWVAAAFFLGVFVVTVVTTPRVLRNTSTMLSELDRRETAPPLTQ